MSVHFEKLNIKDIRKETADCVSVAFDVPEHLREQFQYKQGQYITLRSFIDNAEIRRSYSLCSSPLEQEWRVAIKKTPGGLFSTFANEHLQTGDVLEVMPPEGRFFTELQATQGKQYVTIAAGSGITPVISIIKTILLTEPHSTVTLVYGNRNRHSIIFREELEALKNKYMHRFRLIHVLSREITDANINTGRIDNNKCNELFTRMLTTKADEFFICGPEDMTLCVRDFLLEKGVDRKRVHIELFTASKPTKEKAPLQQQTNQDEPESKISIKLDGTTFHFDLAYDGENILDAALHHGADLPFSCKGGVCCTCRARLVEGEIEMEVNYALEPEEVEQGFILTCQAHPRSEKVVIDFDVK
jgi:ring-1,2-phenylacetyl-CoA epoxidase subunit PaaE